MYNLWKGAQMRTFLKEIDNILHKHTDWIIRIVCVLVIYTIAIYFGRTYQKNLVKELKSEGLWNIPLQK